MRMTIFGATGNIGRRVAVEARSRGHHVTAVARGAERLANLPEDIDGVVGDASDVPTVLALSRDQDLVVDATRPAAGSEPDLVTTTEALLAGAARSGVRLLVVGGASSLRVPGGGGALLIDDDRYVRDGWRAIAQASFDQFEACRRDINADWTYLSPPAFLLEGRRTGRYRTGNDELVVDSLGSSTISMEDLAVAVVDEAEVPRHRGRRFTVAY